MKIRYYTIKVSKKDAGIALWQLDTRAYEYFAVFETRDHIEYTIACYPIEYIFEMIGLLLNGVKVRRV